jgi:signal transduction histidine kinase
VSGTCGSCSNGCSRGLAALFEALGGDEPPLVLADQAPTRAAALHERGRSGDSIMNVLVAGTIDLVPTGLPFGSVRWGANLCHFYKTASDLEEIVAAFFTAGIANRERCVWLTPLTTARARIALASIPELDARIGDGQLSIHEPGIDVLEHERVALRDGFTGLRVCGDTAWADGGEMHGRRLTTLCSYALDRCDPHEIMQHHKSALMRRNGTWEHLGSATAALALVESEIVDAAAMGSREHFAMLQAITSALGTSVTFDDIGAVVTAELAPAVGATRVGLVIGGHLIALRGITTPEDAGALGQGIDELDGQWTARPGPDVAWVGGSLVAVLPLAFANARAGTLLLGFDRPSITPAQRALVDGVVRELALCVERTRIYELGLQDRLRAERACATRDQFLSLLGHELRNPLSPILSAAQLMRLRAPEQLVKERSTIERSVQQMIRLVDDLQDVMQIARGGVTLAREPLELGELVTRALATVRPVLDERVQFAVAVAQRGLLVDVDPCRIIQVLVKLILNAATSTTAQDCIEISARVHGDVIELVVRDHGAGIEAERIPHLFDLFGGDRRAGGLGVGLAITHAIVELHGGTITAASDGEGTGSTFTVHLPRWQVERTTDEVAIPVVPGGRKILVVDDNEDAAWLLAEALRLLGHDVQVSYDGLSALELARSYSPEIALLDIGLPGMNGFELCRALGNLPVQPYCIAVSGYGQPKDRAMAREAGFEAHFVKPVDLRDVQAAIDALTPSN